MPKLTKAASRRLLAASGEKIMKAKAYFLRHGMTAEWKKCDTLMADCFKLANKLK